MMTNMLMTLGSTAHYIIIKIQEIQLLTLLLFTCRYLYDSWNEDQQDHEITLRDHQQHLHQSASSNKELQQHLPSNSSVGYANRPPSVSPYASQSTVKEVSVSVSSSAVPSVVVNSDYLHTTTSASSAAAGAVSSMGAQHHHQDSTSSYPYHGDPALGSLDDTQYYDAQESQYEDKSSRLVPSSQAYEYDNNSYDDWSSYGYYDEAGNYVQYESYYDEKGNLIDGGTSGGDVYSSLNSSYPSASASAATAQYGSSSVYTTAAVTHTTTTTTSIYATTTSTGSGLKTNTTPSSGQLATVKSTAVVAAPPTITTKDTTMTMSTMPIQSSLDQYEDANYYGERKEEGAVDPYGGGLYGDEAYGGGDNSQAYGNYEGDASYWYEGQEEEAGDAFASKPLEGQSSVEYNYAYQSAENLSFEPSKSESVSRRASFRRQTSTRGDFDGNATGTATAGGMVGNHLHGSYLEMSSGSAIGTTMTTAATSVTTTTSTTTNAAAAAANKLTSEIKSALPGLTSLTKGKGGDLLSSSFSKLGSFMSSAAAKTGVNVPAMPSLHKDIQQPPPVVITSTSSNMSAGITSISTTSAPMTSNTTGGTTAALMDQGYSMDDPNGPPYDSWNGHHHQNGSYEDPYGYIDGEQHYMEGDEMLAGRKQNGEPGVPHMDSVESGASEGLNKDGDEAVEAEYWQRQKERIAKQASLATQESTEYYGHYDPYSDTKNAGRSVDSTDESNRAGGTTFERDEYTRQNSLDRDEWLRELEKQSGGRIRPTLSKKDTMSMSLDERSESIDQDGTEYGDGDDSYDLRDDRRGHGGGMRQESLESGDYPMSPPPSQKPPQHMDGLMPDGDMMHPELHRKGSGEKDAKGSKSVSFEEEPPKISAPAVPERITKGMTPREKWLWAMNRICAQLAVGFGSLFIIAYVEVWLCFLCIVLCWLIITDSVFPRDEDVY